MMELPGSYYHSPFLFFGYWLSTRSSVYVSLHRFINGPVDKSVDAFAPGLSVGLDLISFPLWDCNRDPVIMIFNIFGDTCLLLL